MIKFGTGGWRAVIAEDFTFENVRRVAKGLSIMINSIGDLNKPIVVGHDLRFLSGRFSRAFSEVLAFNGIKVFFIDEAVPTPMVMYAVDQEKIDYGVIVTASHNPPEYNGIKIIVEKGKDAPVDVTEQLEEITNSLFDEEIKHEYFFDLVDEGKIQYYSNKNKYIDSLLSQVDVKEIMEKNFKVLFNPMYGVSNDIMKICLSTLRCSVETINDYRDTMFGLHVPSPERESLQDMEYKMRNSKYNIGIATDGDSDRLGLYDEGGNYVDANKILKLLYYYLKEYRKVPGGLVRNLTTTHILDRIAAEYNEEVYEVPVGFKYISAKMEERDLLLGGESSGGFKLRGHVNGKDGILAALLSVEMIAKTAKPISVLLKEIDNRFGSLFFHSMNILYRVEERERLSSILFKEKYIPLFPLEIEKVSYMDGVKFYFKNGNWLSIRFSGTESLIRIYMEMNSKEYIKECNNTIIKDKKLGLVFPTG